MTDPGDSSRRAFESYKDDLRRTCRDPIVTGRRALTDTPHQPRARSSGRKCQQAECEAPIMVTGAVLAWRANTNAMILNLLVAQIGKIATAVLGKRRHGMRLSPAIAWGKGRLDNKARAEEAMGLAHLLSFEGRRCQLDPKCLDAKLGNASMSISTQRPIVAQHPSRMFQLSQS